MTVGRIWPIGSSLLTPGLNIPIKRQFIRLDLKNKAQLYAFYKEHTL